MLLTISVAQFTAPQPLRLLTTDWCSVELVAGYSHDLSIYSQRHRPNTSCYHTMLHWYGSDGTHIKLDIRRIIRKSIKDVSTLSIQLTVDLVVLGNVVPTFEPRYVALRCLRTLSMYYVCSLRNYYF